MKIGILATGHSPDELEQKHGKYPDMFVQLLDGYGFEYEAFYVLENQFPDSVDECDGWLITGSKHGVYEDHAWIAPLEKFIKVAYERDIPIVGICFGHQIMAQALGGRVEKYSKGWGLGQMVYKTEQGEKKLFAVHQDQVIDKPANSQVIATSDFCENAGLAYKGSALSFQPHPEFSPEFMRDLIKVRSGTSFPKKDADAGLASVEENNHSGEIAAQIAEFFMATLNEKAA